MDWWYWIARFGWFCFGGLAGVVGMAVLAMASQAASCEGCQYYQEWLTGKKTALEHLSDYLDEKEPVVDA